MSSARLPLLHQWESRGPERRRIQAVRGAGSTPRLLPLLKHSAAQGRVPAEHGPPARLSCRGWRAVLPLLGTASTPAQPQVTAWLGPGPLGGVCDRPLHGEEDLTSFLHPASGQQGGLSNLVGQETEARSSSQQTTDAELLRKRQTWPSLEWRGWRGCGQTRGGVARPEEAWPGQRGRGPLWEAGRGPRR